MAFHLALYGVMLCLTKRLKLMVSMLGSNGNFIISLWTLLCKISGVILLVLVLVGLMADRQMKYRISRFLKFTTDQNIVILYLMIKQFFNVKVIAQSVTYVFHGEELTTFTVYYLLVKAHIS